MPTYSVCNAALESDLAFPELDEVECSDPEFRFRFCHTSAGDGGDCEWLHIWSLEDGTPWLLLGRLASGYLLRFPEMGDFAVSQDAGDIRCYARSHTPAATIRHLFLDQVVPLLLSRQGCLVLHGSAVSVPEGAIAFVGPTGSGKSTLASSFSKDGMAVLTDDCLLLQEECGRLTAIPSYPGVRLWPETADAMFGKGKTLAEVAHYTEKRRVDRSVGIEFCTRPTELRRMYFLPPPEEAEQTAEVRIEPLSSRDAVVELVKYTYLIDVTDRQRLRQEFERLSRVAVQPLFYRLACPRDFSRLAEVRQAIVDAG
jgi:GTPase SAR1 family protein